MKFACDYYTQIDSENREPLLDYTSNQVRERSVICQLLRSRGCSREKQKFNALTLWAEAYDRPEMSGHNLSNYLDGLIAAANEIDLEDAYNFLYFSIDTNSIYFKSLNSGYGKASLDTIGQTFQILYTDNINLIGEIQTDPNNETVCLKLKVNVKDESGSEYDFDLDTSDIGLQNM